MLYWDDTPTENCIMEKAVINESLDGTLKKQLPSSKRKRKDDSKVDNVNKAKITKSISNVDKIKNSKKKSFDVENASLIPKEKVVKKQHRFSKRGENENSEVRYDKRHKDLALNNDSSKKNKLISSIAKVESFICDKSTASSNDSCSVVSGNEDDAGSVVSAILDEDICYMCGLCTLGVNEWNNIVMCDICDGEYHLQCQNIFKIPDGSFTCSKCTTDMEHYKNMEFSVSDSFKIIPKPDDERTVVYSPSKPIEIAWKECESKGLMVVSNVFTYEIMSKLTHGLVEKVMQSGRVAGQWRGATVEVGQRLDTTACYGGIIDRNGRYDLKLPEYVVTELKLEKVLEPILSRLTGIMGKPVPQLRTHNVVFVPVGSGIQEWHVDDSMIQRKLARYYTILINLNPLDSYCGGTEVWIDKLKRGDLIRGRPGDALVFPGSLLHRGHANNGSMHRFFYYASFACGVDANAGPT